MNVTVVSAGALVVVCNVPGTDDKSKSELNDLPIQSS